MDPITTTISVVLSKIVLDKFYEGVSSKLGEKVVEKALAPIEKLGSLLWSQCLKITTDPKKVEKLVEDAASGSEEAKKSLAQGVDHVLANDTQLEADVRKLAEEIHQYIDVDIQEMNGGEIWNVAEGATVTKEVTMGDKFMDVKAPVFTGSVENSPITISFGTSPH